MRWEGWKEIDNAAIDLIDHERVIIIIVVIIFNFLLLYYITGRVYVHVYAHVTPP